MSPLTDSQYELFSHLTERPFLVIDTEYCHHQGTDHLISVGIAPVIRGRRVRSGELYIEMNPGVPIDEATAAHHGFSDSAVAGKRPFNYYAPKILAALDVDRAVLVSHTAVDIRILTEHLERARAEGGDDFVELPDLPLIDTSALPRLVQHPVAAGRSTISLPSLCAGTGVPLKDHHNALADARATADALIKLLSHAAAEATFGTLEDLLRAHDRGTARAPRGLAYPRGRRHDLPIPRSHLHAHAVAPLTHAGSPEEQAAWVTRATACIRLRCPLLREEAALAAPLNGLQLFDPLVALLDSAEKPGMAGTLAGAVKTLIDATGPFADGTVASSALSNNRALRWWAKFRTRLQAAPRCNDDARCPDCRERAGCPTDLLYQSVVEVTVFSDGPDSLTTHLLRSRHFGDNPARSIHKWPRRHPKEAAYMVELVCRWTDRTGISYAPYLAAARAAGIELLEPRLALRVLNEELTTRGYAHTEPLAFGVLDRRTSDPAYDEIEAWLSLHASVAAAAARKSATRQVVIPRLARPAGRVPINPYNPF